MKKIIYIFIQIITLNCIGQNLVQNPSFEQYILCPNNSDQLYNCQLWHKAYGTPDYFNTCAVQAVSPPTTFNGFQYPHSGNAYAGFYTYLNDGGFYPVRREIIENPLSSALIINQKYYISFYINNGGGTYSKLASNKIGYKFTTVLFSDTNPTLINNFAHFYTDSVITDTVKWVKLSGSFIADSAYNYIMLGNFFDDANTDTNSLATINNTWAYYFIDDVCVTTDSLFNANWTGISEQTINKSENITIYPNPCTNELNVQYNNVPNEQTTISILDITGKTIMQTQTKESEFTFNTEKLAKGLFLVKVEIASTVALQKVTRE